MVLVALRSAAGSEEARFNQERGLAVLAGTASPERHYLPLVLMGRSVEAS